MAFQVGDVVRIVAKTYRYDQLGRVYHVWQERYYLTYLSDGQIGNWPWDASGLQRIEPEQLPYLLLGET